jgi:hypothetical protein
MRAASHQPATASIWQAPTLLLLTGAPAVLLPAVAAGLLGGQAIYLYGDYWLGLWASKPPETQQEVGEGCAWG